METLGGTDEVGAPVDFAPLEFQDAEVFHAGTELDAGGGGDGAGGVVGGYGYAVSGGHGGDAGHFEDAAAVFHVGHDDVDSLFAAEGLEAFYFKEEFSAGHLLLDTAADGYGVGSSFGSDGFFVPIEGDGLQLFGYRDGAGDGEERMAVGHDFDVFADGFADGEEAIDALLDVGFGIDEVVPGGEFEGAEALGYGAFGGGGEAGGGAGFGGAIDVGVDGEGVADFAAQERMHGDVERFAGHIPHGLFEGRVDGAGEEVGEGGGLAEVFDVEGGTVAEDFELAVNFDAHGGDVFGGGGVDAEGVGGFAEAVDIGVGAETDEEPDGARGGADGPEFDAGDFDFWPCKGGQATH